MNTTAEQLVDQMISGMDQILTKVKPDLDEVEKQLLAGMVQFGASHTDVEKVRVWLRPMMEEEVKKQIFERVTKSL